MWRYYNDGKVWLAKGLYNWAGVPGGQNEKTIFWLSIWDGFFKVTIYVPEKARADLSILPLNNGVKIIIAYSKQIGIHTGLNNLFQSINTIVKENSDHDAKRTKYYSRNY